MKFIELTQRSGTKIFINADAIQSVERRPMDDMTTVYVAYCSGSPHGCLYVQEEPEKIIMLATKGSIAYSVDFVDDMRNTIVDTANALAESSDDKVATAWAAINKKEQLLEQIGKNKGSGAKVPEDSDASCLLRSIYQIAFSRGASSTEEVLKDKEDLLQALCKHKQVYAEQTEPDTWFENAYLRLLKELYCVDSLCEGSVYYLENIGNSIEYIEHVNDFICGVYETLFPGKDSLCSTEVVERTDAVLNEIRDLKNTALRVHECAEAESALNDAQYELSNVSASLDSVNDALQDIKSMLNR